MSLAWTLLRSGAFARRAAPWCMLLLSRGAFAHANHTEHPSHAQSSSVLLSLDQAIALGAENGPEVTKAKATHAAARELGNVAAPLFTQLPYVQTQVGPRLSRGVWSPEVIVSVNQPFTLGDTAGVQKRVARATSHWVHATTRSAELWDARRAADAWITVALADRVLQLRREFSEQATSLVALAKARVAAGEAQPVELALAESELSDALSMVIDAEGLHYSAELDLAYAIGQPSAHVDASEALTLPRSERAAEVAPNAAQSRSVTHPDVATAETRAELAFQQVEYAKLQQAPTLALGVQYQREGTGDQIVTAIATVPLPVARPWAFQQTQQRVAADAARAEVAQVRVASEKALRNARHEVHHTRTQYDHLASSALPPLREAHRLATLRYTHGETDFAAVSLVRQRLLRTEERVAEALALVQRADVEWRALTGILLARESR